MRLAVALLLLASCQGSKPDRPPLRFSPSNFPDARVGQPYTVDIRAHGQQTPVCGAQVGAGALPRGLVLEKTQDGARISGTPEEEGDFAFTLVLSCFGTQTTGQMGEMRGQIRVAK